MSWLQVLAGVVLVVVVVPELVGRARLLAHRPANAVGDRRLAAAVDSAVAASVGRRVRRLGVVWIDLAADPVASMAFVDADATSPFEIGSISKALTGLMVADAVDRGELTLATALGQLDPRYRGSRSAAITVAELATHTSGLSAVPWWAGRVFGGVAFGLCGADPHRRSTPSAVIRAVGRQRLRGRGSYRYSNLGAAALGNAVAAHAGTDYATLLTDRVLGPLAMTGTGVGFPVPRGWRRSGRRARPWRMPGYAPAGAVVSTPADMAVLAEAVLRGCAPGMAATSPVDGVPAVSPNRRQGLFWVLDTHQPSGRRQVWHNGQTGGYSAFLAVYPDAGRAVVALTDTAAAERLRQLADQVTTTMLRTRLLNDG